MKKLVQQRTHRGQPSLASAGVAAICMLSVIAGAACTGQDPSVAERPAPAGSMVWDDVPLTADFDPLVSQAQQSQPLVDEIDVLQAAGWSSEDAASFRGIQNAQGIRGLARVFSHASDSGTASLELRFVPDPATGAYGATIEASDGARDVLSETVSELVPLETAGGDDTAAVDGTRSAVLRAGAVPPRNCGYLRSGEGLLPGHRLSSCNGLYHIDMQSDGNLVAYTAQGAVVWASGTDHHHPQQVIMQSDGNLVVYFSDRSPWATNTTGRAGDANGFFRMQDDGNLVVYNAGSLPRWSSDTWCEVGVRGHACRLRQCGYVTQIRAGDIVHCGSTPGMFSYDRVVRSGHVGALDQGLYADRFGVGQTCPLPNHASFQTNICGHAPGH